VVTIFWIDSALQTDVCVASVFCVCTKTHLIDLLVQSDILSALWFGFCFFSGERLKYLNTVLLFIVVLSNSEFRGKLLSMFYSTVMKCQCVFSLLLTFVG